MHLNNLSAAQRINNFRKAQPQDADALLQQAAGGDVKAADAIAQGANVSRLDALAFAKDAAEARVWDKGNEGGIKQLLSELQQQSFAATNGGIGAGETVARLGGFRDFHSPVEPGRKAALVDKALSKIDASQPLSAKDLDKGLRALSLAVADAGGDPTKLAALQERHGDLLGQLKGSTIHAGEGGDLCFVNGEGKIAEHQLTQANAKDFIRELNGIGESSPGSTYELRQHAMEMGHLTTTEAFTYGGVDVHPKDIKPFVDAPANWLPQRRELHDQLFQSAVDKAGAFSDAIACAAPTVFAMRGNTAAGKTRTIKDIPSLAPAGDFIKAEPKSAINPDNFKKELIDHEADAGISQIDHVQAHVEGSMLTRRLWSELEGSEKSCLVDRRLGPQSDFDEIVRSAQSSGKRVELYDIDASLEASLCGVLTRPPGGDDPIPPFAAIAHGFKEIRQDRLKMIKQAVAEENVDRYQLFATKEDGSKAMVASMEGDQLKIHDDGLFDFVTGNPDALVEKARATVIDDDFIEAMAGPIQGPFSNVMRASLEKYRGMNLEQAIEQHGTNRGDP